MTPEEAIDAFKARTYVRDTMSGLTGPIMGLKHGTGMDDQTLFALVCDEWTDVLDVELIHADDAR